MAQRGISVEELERVLNNGWEAQDAKPGTFGKVLVFGYGREWQGRIYPEKEVSVYYKGAEPDIVLLTAKARYGEGFARRDLQ